MFHKDNELNLAVSVSHPWLGDGLTKLTLTFASCNAIWLQSIRNSAIQYSDHGSELPLPVPPPQLSGLNSSLVQVPR